MTITISEHGIRKQVEILKKVNQGLHLTHNHDGRFQKMWALGVDGCIYRTTSRGQYRPMQDGEIAPEKLFTTTWPRCRVVTARQSDQAET
jgi:hypothetical protein